MGSFRSESMVFSRNFVFLPLEIWPSDISGGQKYKISSKIPIDSEENEPITQVINLSSGFMRSIISPLFPAHSFSFGVS